MSRARSRRQAEAIAKEKRKREMSHRKDNIMRLNQSFGVSSAAGDSPEREEQKHHGFLIDRSFVEQPYSSQKRSIMEL